MEAQTQPESYPKGEMLIGRVVAWTSRGFGRIRTDAGKEFFVHRVNVIDLKSLRRGMTVRFAPMPRGKGEKTPRAVNVEIFGFEGQR